MMYNGSPMIGSGNGCGTSWIGDLGDAQKSQRMLLVDVQSLIVHITCQLFKCERLGVVSVYLSSNS
jgi:hypothetical protein